MDSAYIGIRQFLNGVEAQNILTINGGTVTGTNSAIYFQDPNAKANSGTLTIGEDAKIGNRIYLDVTEGSTEWPVEIAIAAAALGENATIVEDGIPEGYEVQLKNGVYGVAKVNYVAQIGDVKYESLTAAAEVGGEILVLTDLAETVTIPEGKTVSIDLNGKTLTGSILAPNADLKITNGKIVNTDSGVSALEINAGTLTLTKVDIDSARHAVRIDGAVTATIDGGTYRGAIGNGTGTYHAVNISKNANVTIKSGTFVGPRGTTSDSGSAVLARGADTIVLIEGGSFSGGKNATLANKDSDPCKSFTVTGGTYDQDPTAFVADGYAALRNLNDQFVVGVEPTATITNLGKMTVAAGKYIPWGTANDDSKDMPLNFVMQYAADQTAEDMKTSPYAGWYGDFVITFTGLKNGSITVDEDTYLAGFYGETENWEGLWVKVGLTGETITEGTRYPVMIGVGMPQTYEYICAGVEEFLCAMNISEEILKNNPDLKVNLELAVVDSADDAAAAEALATADSPYVKIISNIEFEAEDFTTSVAKIGDTYYATLADALAAVGEGDVVIELLADAELAYGARTKYGTDATTSLTINGNGHVLNMTGTDTDWSSIGLKNEAAKLTINDLTINQTSTGNGSWNNYAIIFTSILEMNNVNVNKSMAVENNAVLNNVNIKEANGYYGLWITADVESVTVNGGSITATNGGRGIKIGDEYVDVADLKVVDLKVTDTVFNTAKKAAILVTSPTGAKVTTSNINIANVAEDSDNAVWVDEERATTYGNVSVNGGYAAQESVETFVATTVSGNVLGYYKTLADAIAAADTDAVVNLTQSITTETVVAKEITINKNGKTAVVTAGDGYEIEETDTAYVVKVKAAEEKPNVNDSHFTLSSRSLLLEDIVHIRYVFDLSESAENASEKGVLIWNNKSAAESYDRTAAYVAKFVANGSLFDADSDGIPAKNMGDVQYYAAYAVINGEYVYSQVREFSPKMYAEIVNDKTGSEWDVWKTLVTSLMHYGAYAQMQFNYNTENLMNSAFSEFSFDDSILADYSYTRPTATVNGFTYYSASLNLVGKVEYIFTYSVDTTQTGADLYLEYQVGNTTMDVKMTHNNGRYYDAVLPGLPAKELDTAYTVKPYYMNGAEKVYGPECTFGAYQYANAVVASSAMTDVTKNLSRAVVAYQMAAAVAFGSN